MKKKKIKICSVLLTCSWAPASHPLCGMTRRARSRPLQSVRQAATARPTQSPPCQRQLAPSPHMLTASLPGGLHPFGPALLLLEQGSKARGGQAVLGGEQTRSSCVVPSPSCPSSTVSMQTGKEMLFCLLLQQHGLAWEYSQQDNSRTPVYGSLKVKGTAQCCPVHNGVTYG